MTARLILLVGGADPAPEVTARRDVRVESVADADEVRLRAMGSSPVGLVGVGSAGRIALEAAADLGSSVDRLALVAVPAPIDGQEVHAISHVKAKTLVLCGQRDPAAAAADATRLKSAYPALRVEMVPRSVRLELADVWIRVLSHVAPNTTR